MGLELQKSLRAMENVTTTISGGQPSVWLHTIGEAAQGLKVTAQADDVPTVIAKIIRQKDIRYLQKHESP